MLIGALQARNNARVVLTGSLAMFSDAFINAEVNKYGAREKYVLSKIRSLYSISTAVFKSF